MPQTLTSFLLRMSRSVDALRRVILLLVLAAFSAPTTHAADPSGVRRYQMAGGDAEQTLRQFVEQSGEQVVYVMTKVRGVKTNPLSGDFTAREALNRLVARTKLTVVQDQKSGALMITVSPPKTTPRNGEVGAASDQQSTPKTQPMKPPRTLLTALVGLLALTQSALAQTAPVSPKPADREAKTAAESATAEDAILLPEFNVTGSDSGWMATNTLSGTRTNMRLKDVPRSVQVLTSEFMSDIGALTMTDASDYMSGVTSVGDQDQTNDTNGYQVRGFRQNNPYRNGIREPSPSMLFDTATMDRIEVLKGPSSLLSGIVDVGGMMNSISKAPGNRKTATITLRGDNWGMRRADADVTIPLTKRLSSRFVLVRQAGDAWQQFAWNNRTVLYGALSYKLTENTRLTTNVEYIDYLAALPAPRQGGHSTLTYLTFRGNNILNGINANGVYIPWDFNPFGPNNRRDQQIIRTSNQVEHRFNAMFSVRASANYSRTKKYDRRVNGAMTVKTVNGLAVPDTITLLGTDDNDTFKTFTSQADLVGRFKYFGIEQQSILGAEFIDYDQLRFRFDTAPLSPYRFSTGTAGAWTEMLDDSRWNIPRDRRTSQVRRYAYSLTNVFALFNSRVFLMAGARHDMGTIASQNPLNASVLARNTVSDENAVSPTFGLTYRVTNDLSVFVSTSRSFSGVPVGSVDIYGDPLSKHISGEGLDAGIKTAFLENRLIINATAFQVDRINDVRATIEQDFIDAGLGLQVGRSVQDVSSRSRGWETDITVKPFKGYQVLVTYTNLHAFVLSNRRSPATVGGPLTNGPGRESWSVFQKYDLPGQMLKGFTVTHGMVFRDGKRPNVRGFLRHDASASYRTKLFNKSVSIVLRVQNVQDIMYWQGNQARGAPRTTSLQLTTRF
jgi:iron complex outermembrane receptor protein